VKHASLAVLALLSLAGPARADDARDTADTIASTWTGGALRLAADDKRFVLALTTLREGLRARVELSAPLDDNTRTAAFVGKDGIVPGFRGNFYVGYDSTFSALALTPSDQELLAYCERKKIEPCLLSKVQAEQERNGQPLARQGFYWGAGLNLSYAFDRKTAYVDDIAADTSDFRTSDLQLDATAIVTLPSRWTFSVRAGYERANKVALGDFRRCMPLPSTDMAVTGEACTDEKVLLSDPPAKHSTHVRLAGAYYPFASLLAQYISATELRLNAENLSTDSASFDVHLLAFANAIHLGDGSARIGLGVTVRTALETPDGADYKAGDVYDYSLFGIAGASF
jgi:hypothetical protein